METSKNIQSQAPEQRRTYSSPILTVFGHFTTLTGNGGSTPIPDAGKSTKGGP